MRDFPVFTTEYGTAGLILREIPYRRTAYIRLGETLPGAFREHLQECVSFCTMAGAERIYATGHEALEGCDPGGSILEMRGQARPDPEKTACLFPVTEETAGSWREIYNRRMASVPHASTLEARDEKKLATSTGAYFIHRNGRLLGIGWLEDTKLLAVAAEEKGAGETLMHTLMALVEGETVTLEVASENRRAIALYERLGFIKAGEKTRWYCVY